MSFLDGFLNQRPTDQKEDQKEGQKEDQEEKKLSEPTSGETMVTSGGDPISADEKKKIQHLAAEKIREIYDPEIPVNIYELGLIYDIDVNDFADVIVIMTLTSPHCPVAESMPGEVEFRVREVEGVGNVKVELVWEPPWDMSMMSEAARLEMGFM